MAKGALFIGWGETFPGYREKALKVFNEGVQFWTRMQEKGEVDSFEHVFLDYHGGDLSGFVLIRGERDKLNRIRTDSEFSNLLGRVQLIVSKLGVVDAFIGEGLQSRLANFQKQISELD